MKKTRRLLDEYRFPGFRPLPAIKGKFGDNKARIIQFIRLQKKLSAAIAVLAIKASTTEKSVWYVICPVVMLGFIWKWRSDVSIV